MHPLTKAGKLWRFTITFESAHRITHFKSRLMCAISVALMGACSIRCDIT